MKTPRMICLLLGALGSAAGLFAQIVPNNKYSVPAPGTVHPDYRLVSTLQQRLTMKGLENIVEWSCYADYDKTYTKPHYRCSAWLVGVIGNPAGKPLALDLTDLGVQHRDHIILVRTVASDRYATTELIQTKGVDQSVYPRPCPTEKLMDAQGNLVEFYRIDISSPDKIDPTILKNVYELRTNDTALRLEAIFWDHLPGTHKGQAEDGGPPPVPPINEN